MEKLDTEYTDQIVCPYCGEVDRDSWESTGAQDEQREMQCGSCGKNFIYTTHISVSYSSSQCDCLNGGEHKWCKPQRRYDGVFFKKCADCGEIQLFKHVEGKYKRN